MTKEEIIKYFDLEDGVVFFEPTETFNKGIIGVSEDHNHLIYGYYKLAEALAEDYEKEWNSKEHSEDEEQPDFYMDACEWLDYNTIGSLPYIASEYGKEPIICFEILE